MNVVKKKKKKRQTHKYREQTSSYQEETEGKKSSIATGEEEVQMIRHKINWEDIL